MANFKLIYQILTLLDKYLDYDEPDLSRLTAQYFKVSENPSITLRGLEYLEENSTMKKAYRLLKGIKDVTPKL